MPVKTEKKETTKVITRREVTVSIPVVKVPGPFQGFVDFVREQGVVGLAVGLVLGTQAKVLIDQIVASFINPLLGLLLPGGGSLVDKTFSLSMRGKTQDFTWGAFVSQLISFLAVAFLVYMIVHRLKLDKLDKKKA